MFSYSRLLLFIVLLSTTAYTALAQENDPWYSEYGFSVGVAYKQITFTVQNRETLEKQGALSEEMQISPSIGLSSPYFYFSDDLSSRLGWNIEWGYSSFEVSKQEIGSEQSGQLVDMGTSVEGQYAYISPVIFYNFGDRSAKMKKGQSLKLGLGYGISYLQAKGSIILTETPEQTRKDVNIDEIGYAVSVFIDWRLSNLLIRIRGNAPIIDEELEKETSKNIKTSYQVFEYTADISYVIYY